MQIVRISNSRAFGGLRQSVGLLAIAVASGCGGGSSAPDRPSADPPAQQPMSAQALLGQRIFSDPSLSASGRLACASCHVETSGHAPENDLPAQFGGALLDQQGLRNTPSINYLAFNPAFSFAADGSPRGGLLWDGRADSLQQQAADPLLAANEMANKSRADVVDKLARAAYADEFRTLFGADIFSRPDAAFDQLAAALQAYQREDIAFRAFTSKYDEFLRGNVGLSEQESRGLALFNNPAKGNCQACHPSARAADGSLPLFTDFSYASLGIPRNPALQHNADPGLYDLGLCRRAELSNRTDLCGAFKAPSLRNVAIRRAYFHNGRFKTLKEVLTFYVQRDTHPEKWYPLDADGHVKRFDDLPPTYHANVETTRGPYARLAGGTPALSDAEIDDMVVFLQTLTDGFRR